MTSTLLRSGRRLRLASLVLVLTACLVQGAKLEAQTPAPALQPADVQAPQGSAPSAEVREGYADVPGARLSYLDSGGNGIPIVFLHAGTGSARVWEYQIPAVTAAGYRFIAYDRRGYGRTTVDAAGPVSTPADDLNALITHLGIERFHLVGTAAGGGVALDYALSFPQRLRSLVVANSLGNATGPEYSAMIGRLLGPAFSALPPELRELGPAYRAGNADGTKRWVDLEHVSRAPGDRPAPQPSKNRATFTTLESLRVPTLIVTGDADMYSPPPLMKLYSDRIPNAEFLAIRAAGHSAYWEEPEIFNRAVLEFVRQH